MDFCEGNSDFREVLSRFGEGYIPIYNKRKVALRNEIKIYLKRNFNTWYISPKSMIAAISPACLINSAIYNEFGSDAVVYPVCDPVYKKDKLVDVTYDYRVFTLEDHPFVRDIELFLETAVKLPITLHPDDSADSIFGYILKKYDVLISCADFTFQERPYLLVLAEVCERLSLIRFTGSRTGITRNDDNADKYLALSDDVKLERIINALIERFIECFDYLPKKKYRPTAADVLGALQKSLTFSDYWEALFGDFMKELIDEANMIFNNYIDTEDGFESFLEGFDEEKAMNIIMVQQTLSICCSHFFTAFGQYLQLIRPENDDAFEFMKSDDEYLDMIAGGGAMPDLADKATTSAMIYYMPPGGYDLTPLGNRWFDKGFLDDDEQEFPLLTPDEYEEAVTIMLKNSDDEDMERIIAELMDDPDRLNEFLDRFSDFLE